MSSQDAPQTASERCWCAGVGLRVLGSASDYAALHGLLRSRRADLGLSFETLAAISGLGHVDKLLAPMPASQARGPDGRRPTPRNIGPVAWGPLLGALGLKLVVVEDIAATERLKARQGYVRRAQHCVNAKALSLEEALRQRSKETGHIGGKRALETMTREERQRRARKAARMRWKIERLARKIARRIERGSR